MNLIKSSLIATAAVISLTGAAFAQEAAATPAPAATTITTAKKIVTVDMEKIFNEYHKTRTYQAELNGLEKKIQEGNAKRVSEVQAIEKEMATLQTKYQDTSLAEDARKKFAEEFELKNAERVALEQDRQRYWKSQTTSLQERKNGIRNEIVAEITTVINAKAEAAGYDLVIDKSAASIATTKVIAYSAENLDITTVVLTELNKDAKDAAPAAE